MAGAKESAYYNEAERLYVEGGKTLEQIREALQKRVSVQTLSRWNAKGGWAARRADHLATRRKPLVIARDVQAQVLAQIKKRQDAAEAEALDVDGLTKLLDGLAKIEAVIRRLESQEYDTRTICLEAMRHYVDFVRKSERSSIKDDPEALEAQERLVQAFFKHLEEG